jgi:ATP-dependent DNA helicase PIF1
MKNLNNILNILIEKKKSVFITGPAGTGKTHLILQIYHELKQKNKNVILTSTTGLNAMNIGGITVHKLFGLQTRSDLNYIKYMKSTFLFRGICLRMKKIEYVIIDEVSMLRSDTFELIDEILKKATNSNIPFGGKILIMSGDFFQTPPVSKK